MVSRLSDHLALARQRLVVGRTSEIAIFRSALEAEQLPFHLLNIFGPGGVGKTTLLDDFRRFSAHANHQAIYLDARSMEPTPDAFLNELQLAMGLTASESAFERLSSLPLHPVVMIDTYEILAPLDDWLSKTFFPQLPENVLIVLAGREPLSPAWRADPGWQSLIRVLPLRNLTLEDSKDYLSRREIPQVEHQAILDFTHGHPLALSLVADVFAQRRSLHFQPEDSPDIVKTLLEQFVQKVPGPAHRTALEACALVRTTTEALLAEMLGLSEKYAGSAHDLFNWLRGLSFIEAGRNGLFPHDLAREALVADLRWRNPDWYAELHRRARNYFMNHLGQSSSSDQQLILMDYVFLHRDNPVVRPFFEWQSGGLIADSMHPGDRTGLKSMIMEFEGEGSAQIAEFWFSHQPQNILVLRDSEGKPAGLLAMIVLQQASPEELSEDPATRTAWQFLQRYAPLRPGEIATHFRFWMARDTYQDISPAQSQIIVHIVRHYLTTPGLAFTFFPVANPDFWAPLAAYANLMRIPDADYEVGGHRYGVYGHDWRAEPPMSWLTILADREINASSTPIQAPQVSEQLVVLSHAEFAGAVQEALRALSRPDGLQGNPLARSRLVVDKASSLPNGTDRQQVLRTLIRDVIESLNATPREAKFYRALYHTYIQPAPTQEAAAELLDLPFSTYRRHLKEGSARITEILWQMEIAG